MATTTRNNTTSTRRYLDLAGLRLLARGTESLVDSVRALIPTRLSQLRNDCGFTGTAAADPDTGTSVGFTSPLEYIFDPSNGGPDCFAITAASEEPILVDWGDGGTEALVPGTGGKICASRSHSGTAKLHVRVHGRFSAISFAEGLEDDTFAASSKTRVVSALFDVNHGITDFLTVGGTGASVRFSGDDYDKGGANNLATVGDLGTLQGPVPALFCDSLARIMHADAGEVDGCPVDTHNQGSASTLTHLYLTRFGRSITGSTVGMDFVNWRNGVAYTLLDHSYDRSANPDGACGVAAGSPLPTLTVTVSANTLASLTAAQVTAINAKGYILTQS